MSGWIKVEKDLATDPRVLRMASRLRNADVTLGSRSRLVIVGALVTLWWFADTHIREDDTLPIGADQINELVGVENFCELMPTDWLQIIDANNVKLVDYTAHNGTTAKKRALGQKRQQRHRNTTNADVTHASRSRNTNSVTRPREDLEKNKKEEEEKNTTATASPKRTPKRNVSRGPGETPEWFLDFKLVYPDRAGGQPWRSALRAARAREEEGYTGSEFIDGARRYAAFCAATGKIGTEYVKQAATFLGPDKFFLQPWTLPSSKADMRLAGNLSAADEFMRRTEAQS